MQKKIFSTLIFLLLIIGCSPSTAHLNTNSPEWILKPYTQKKIGAVGSAQEHFKGKTAQRKLAISRALDELAQQSGVEVGNIIMRNEKSTATGGLSSTEVTSTQRTSGVMINAHIEEVWTDPRNKEMHIWLVAD